jgi:molecular chaperone DnaK
MKIGEAIYATKGPAGEGGDGSSEAKSEGDDNVVDADFEEVKDDKKKSA